MNSLTHNPKTGSSSSFEKKKTQLGISITYLHYLLLVGLLTSEFDLQSALMTFEEDKLNSCMSELRALERRCASDIGWLKSMRNKVFGESVSRYSRLLFCNAKNNSNYLKCVSKIRLKYNTRRETTCFVSGFLYFTNRNFKTYCGTYLLK